MLEPRVEYFFHAVQLGPPKVAHFVETAVDRVKAAVHIRKPGA